MRIRPGFTLLEVMAALALVGLTLGIAIRLLNQLAVSRDVISVASGEETDRANGLRLLSTLVYRATGGADPTLRFSGNDRDASFASWCETPAGWLTRCQVTLSVDPAVDGDRVVAKVGATSMRLWSPSTKSRVEFRYFSADGGRESGSWWRGWGTSISAPAAIAVVSERDTLVLPVGAAQ